METYPCVWHSTEHGDLPCRIHSEVGVHLKICLPDPHDPGEVEIEVPAKDVSLKQANTFKDAQ